MATVVGSGDVKYHLGFEGSFQLQGNSPITLQMVPNPSHLEFVNPVVEGVVRAIQDTKYGANRRAVLPLLMHGDAAVAGQGIVFETMGYSLLEGYATGGTVHIVINNQIGFTTTPDESRSTMYCTDFAKGFDCPIFHVNAEDPEAACWVTELAVEYRNTFGKDVFIDLIGYRKHGHNEGDDPSFTQPLTYAEIKNKKPLWASYGETLVTSGVLAQSDIDATVAAFKDTFAAAQERVALPIQGEACSMHGRLRIPSPETGVDPNVLTEIGTSLTQYPPGFVPHPKLAKILEKRVETVTQKGAIEWGVAEALAYGSLVAEGRSVRLSGQDCRRGTFIQRHIILDHYEAAEVFSPIAAFAAKKGSASFEVYNSSLSESGVLGFEFGYGTVAQKGLVMWEAQFGDFSNGAQVIIDQFISSSEAKWGQLSGVTLLLPHAYEGQGPEHSSARLERYLQLCGEGNMSVCYPTTSAQQFHLLRRQGLLEINRPLVVMTPKSLLRLASASSPFEEFTTGSFKPVIEDDLSEGGEVSYVVILAGKIYHDVMPALKALGQVPVKVVRIEQLHPFPQYEFKKSLKDGPEKRAIWVQEEPMNMGAWSYVQPYLQNKLGLDVTYVGRQAAASTATGSPKHHAAEQKAIVGEVVRIVSGKK
jgi:2-oxoglutarate dehydrogenase E1 component